MIICLFLRMTKAKSMVVVVAPLLFWMTDRHICQYTNFGDGYINIFSSEVTFKGQLVVNGNAISIDGACLGIL